MVDYIYFLFLGMTEKVLMLERSLREVNEKYNTEKERRKIIHNNLIVGSWFKILYFAEMF